MTERPDTPADTPAGTPTATPTATAADAPAPSSRHTGPPPASEWVEEHEPPSTEAERQVQETIRSVSRLEESN